MASPVCFHRLYTAPLRGSFIRSRASAPNLVRPFPLLNLTRPLARSQTTFAPRPLNSPQLVAPQRSAPSIVQFLSNKVWQATHRSRSSQVPQSSRARGPFRSPPPPRGPWQQFKEKIESIPSNVIFWGILVFNGVVFGVWQFAWAKYKSTGDPSTYIWMRNNFTVSMSNISAGRIWTLLTACVSHEGTAHLFVNAFTYYFMAPAVLSLLGNTGFLALYLGSGLFASLASLFWNNSIKRNPTYASHGASGAIYGVVSFFACVAPTTQFLLFGIVPIPAWAFVSGVFLWDSYSSIQDARSGTDTAGHVGGLLAGIGFYLRKRFGIF